MQGFKFRPGACRPPIFLVISILFFFFVYCLRISSNISFIDVNSGASTSKEEETPSEKNHDKNKESSAYNTSFTRNESYPIVNQITSNPKAEYANRTQFLLKPIKVMEEYKQQHSRQSLLRDPDNNNDRKFAFVTYSCPDRAGNILHNMFNSMAWAILTNRTILWHYDNYRSTEKDCQQVMERSDWIAGWDEWSKKLDLKKPQAISFFDYQNEDSNPQVVIFPQIPDVIEKDKSIERNSWRDHPMNLKEYINRIQSMEPDITRRAVSLYDEGVNFLFGLLFRETFAIRILEGEDSTKSIRPKGVSTSIALHSRHPVNGDDGSFIDEEKECLSKLLAKYYINSPIDGELTGCHVYLMSDRRSTIDRLSAWVKIEFNCTPVIAVHATSHVQEMEHGPWSGLGFIEDIASASLARTAAVGDTKRSSFMLLAELIEYEQRVEAWRENRPTKELDICKLANRKVDGYNYGPGTPTFIRHNYRPPLAPVKAFQNYKKMHSLSQISNMELEREYIVVDYECIVPMNGTEKEVNRNNHQFFNNMIFAITTNRTILVNKTIQESSLCDGILSMRSWISIYDSNVAIPTTWVDKSESLPTTLSESSYYDGNDTTKNLFTEGIDFLYGMLFSESFHWEPITNAEIKPTGYDPSIEFERNTIALYLDSQSTTSTNINSVLKCLEEAIDFSIPNCNVYSINAMEDNDLMRSIYQWLSDRNCNIFNSAIYNSDITNISIADATTSDEDDENGRRRRRFYQLLRDMNFASKAKTAFVGPINSYTEILIESMEYQRRNHIWKEGRFPPLHNPNLTKCII
jgi:hypothetical protein